MLTRLVQILSNKSASRKRVASTRAVRAKTEAACPRLSDTGAPGRSRKKARRMAPGGLQCMPPGVNNVDAEEAPQGSLCVLENAELAEAAVAETDRVGVEASPRRCGAVTATRALAERFSARQRWEAGAPLASLC